VLGRGHKAAGRFLWDQITLIHHETTMLMESDKRGVPDPRFSTGRAGVTCGRPEWSGSRRVIGQGYSRCRK